MCASRKSPARRMTGTDAALLVTALLVAASLFLIVSSARDTAGSPVAVDRVLTPSHLAVAERRADRILTRYAGLADREQAAVAMTLRTHLIDVDDWVAGLERADPEVVCLGESHGPAVRSFLAERFFSRYTVDRLFLEATPERIGEYRHTNGLGRRSNMMLHGADMGEIVRSVRRANRHALLIGLEGWNEESVADRDASRDRQLASRFWSNHVRGQRHVLLYGALHCSDQRLWLWRHLLETVPSDGAGDLVSVRFIGAEQHQWVASFTRFVEAAGFVGEEFVIADTAGLRDDPRIRQWFPVLAQDLLDRFDAIVVYRVEGGPDIPVVPDEDGRRVFPVWHSLE